MPASAANKDTLSIAAYTAEGGTLYGFINTTVGNTTAGYIKKAVEFSAAENAYNTASTTGTLTGTLYAKTDENGYVKVTLSNPVSATASTVLTAKYDNGNQAQSTTINWTNQSPLSVVANGVKVADDLNSIEVTFNNRIYTKNVTKDLFDVEELAKGDSAGDEITKKITGVSVNGKTVTIQFATPLKEASNCTLKVKLDNKTLNGIDLLLTDEYGYSYSNGITITTFTVQ